MRPRPGATQQQNEISMQHHARTVFDTPVVNTLLRGLSLLILKLCGWKTDGILPPDVKKAVLIAAPHTSNWDLPFTLFVAFALRLKIYWMGKEEIFKPPFRGVMMWLGGIPVQRKSAGNMVQASADALRDASELMLVVSPEGTRSKTLYWKSGFYHIAHTAGVPVVMAYLDYGRKIGGLGPVFHTTGDFDADMQHIKAFYKDKRGKRDLFHAD
ncbi:MAG: lysophospholipid acyltransferase family protein [Moraxellaceae bacterium]|nr:lysophospholipid acyltransferase family protein [Moraxellaceae bacterium]